jgi:hypothetical protein
MIDESLMLLFEELGLNLKKEVDREFYIRNNVDIVEFKKSLINSEPKVKKRKPLENFVNENLDILLLVGWEASQLEKKIVNVKSKYKISKEILPVEWWTEKDEKEYRIVNDPSLIKLLLMLRHTSTEKVVISISSPKDKFTIKNKEFNDLIYRLMDDLFVSEITVNNIVRKVYRDDECLTEMISDIENKNKSKRGAPKRKLFEFVLSEKLLCLLHYDTYKVDPNPDKIRPSNTDCSFIYNFLVFWKIIEDTKKRIETNSYGVIKAAGTPHNYIRSLIKNNRLERINENKLMENLYFSVESIMEGLE